MTNKTKEELRADYEKAQKRYEQYEKALAACRKSGKAEKWAVSQGKKDDKWHLITVSGAPCEPCGKVRADAPMC